MIRVVKDNTILTLHYSIVTSVIGKGFYFIRRTCSIQVRMSRAISLFSVTIADVSAPVSSAFIKSASNCRNTFALSIRILSRHMSFACAILTVAFSTGSHASLKPDQLEWDNQLMKVLGLLGQSKLHVDYFINDSFFFFCHISLLHIEHSLSCLSCRHQGLHTMSEAATILICNCCRDL